MAFWHDSTFWHLLELGVAVAALIVLPTVFQMFWGRPHLEFDTRVLNKDGVAVLICSVFNRPIGSRTLIRLGVRREAATVTCALKIVNVKSGALVFPIAAQPRLNGTDPFSQITIHAGWEPKIFPVARHSTIAVTWDHNGAEVVLPSGTYELRAIFWMGEKTYPKYQEFVITATPAGAYWVH